jgi:hypothetical protein
MPVESALCRALNIRFIDARGLVTALNMDILGYHDETLEESLVAEATRLYEELDDDRKDELRILRSELDGIRIQRNFSMASVGSTRSSNADYSVTGRRPSFWFNRRPLQQESGGVC